MSNVISPYNPVFYAQQGLIQLEKALGMAGRVYRGYEEEWGSYNRGETINIRKPMSFTAQNAPSPAQDLKPTWLTITLNRWKEVKFTVLDNELAFTGDRMIEEHIRPAAYALADDLDQNLAWEYRNVPWIQLEDNTADNRKNDIMNPRKILRDNLVPVEDGDVHFMVNGTKETEFLREQIFHSAGVAGDGNNEQALLRGSLGTRFGVEVFANQNVLSHTPGVAADNVGTLSGAHSKDATSISVAGFQAAGTVKVGDTLVIAGHSQRYAVTADATAVGGAITIQIFPALVQDYTNGSTVTVDLSSGPQNLMFHRNWLALVTAPLPDVPARLGARVAVITDPKSRLSLRSRMWYDGENSRSLVALDILYGYQILEPNLAVRLIG